MSFETPNQPERISVSAAAPRRNHEPRTKLNRVLTHMRKTLILIAAVATAATAAAGQTSTTAATAASTSNSSPMRPPQVCVTDAERHRFDFWIGEWDVTTPDGKAAGRTALQSGRGGRARPG